MTKENSQDTKNIKSNSDNKYFYAVGRRKSSIAKVRIFPKGKGNITVNDISLNEYFTTLFLQKSAIAGLELTDNLKDFDITIKVHGGGKRGQADAIKLGIARALTLFDESLRGVVKKAGLLTRDARVKERKKYGLKKARRAPQWSKR